jgi:WD40 repeat protein
MYLTGKVHVVRYMYVANCTFSLRTAAMCRRLLLLTTVTLSCVLSACLLTDSEPGIKSVAIPDSLGHQLEAWEWLSLPIYDQPIVVAASPDGGQLSVVTEDFVLSSWDLATMTREFSISLPGTPTDYQFPGAISITYDRSGDVIVAIIDNRRLSYDSSSGSPIGVETIFPLDFNGRALDSLRIVAYSSDAKMALATPQFQCFETMPIPHRSYPLFTLDEHGNGPTNLGVNIGPCGPPVLFTPDGSKFANFAADPLLVWDSSSLDVVFTGRAGNTSICCWFHRSPVFSGDGSSVFLLGNAEPEHPDEMCLRGWHTEPWAVYDSIFVPEGLYWLNPGVSHTGNRVALAEIGTVTILDFDTREIIYSDTIENELFLESLTFSPDERYLVVGVTVDRAREEPIDPYSRLRVLRLGE